MEETPMSRTKVAAILSAIAIVASATFASAADHDYARSGPFLGAGGVYAFENFSGSAADANPDGSGGYFLKGGYRFNEWFALEIAFEQYLGFSEGGGGGGDTDLWLIGLNGKFYPFHGIIQPYLLAGAGYTQVNPSASTGESDEDGAEFRFGGGVEVYVTRNWAFSADVGYYLPVGAPSNFGAVPLTFGVLYRFY
jgi:hypothetical protein